MGLVFAATDERTGEIVAVKRLLPGAAEEPQLVGRFLQEARALQALKHPRIVEVRAFERLDDCTAYMAMEYLEGPSLRAWIDHQKGPIEPTVALGIGWQIADAMVEVHKKGIIHRDLKPENIILLGPDVIPSATPLIKLVDFGIAKVPPAPSPTTQTDVQTEENACMGSRPYMAPEQWLDAARATTSTDVYALGVLLYEMIAGGRPFQAQEEAELVEMHWKKEPPPLRKRVPEAPPDLVVLIEAMLAKEPKQRPSMRRCCNRLAELQSAPRGICPFPGLQAFSKAQAELFFGRQADIDDIINRLQAARAGEHRWVQIEGPSGSGKSSLVQAGVRPHLEDVRAADPRWIVASMRPSNNPIHSLARAMVDAFSEHHLVNQSMEEVEEALGGDKNALRDLSSRTPRETMLLLIIEQMEELFSLDKEQRSAFEGLLSAALSDSASPLRLLTTVRNDLAFRINQTPALVPLLNKASRIVLPELDEEKLRQIAWGMARRAEMTLPGALAGQMVREAADTACPLPLLGHTLRALWSPEEDASSTLEQRYRDIGGVGGALAKHAEQLLEEIGEAHGEESRERAKWIILALTQVEHGIPTSRSRTRQEVLAEAGNDALTTRVLLSLSGSLGSTGKLEGLRLVVLSDDPTGDPSKQRVDLIHEALLSAVPTIAGWVNEERSRMERRKDLEDAVRVWEKNDRSEDSLPSGTVLERFRGPPEDERWRQMLTRMNDSVHQFLEQAEQLARRRRRRKHSVAVALLFAAAAIAVIAVYALQQKHSFETTLDEFTQMTGKVVSDLDWKFGRIPGNLETRNTLLTTLDDALKELKEHDRENPAVRIVIIKTKHRRGDISLEDHQLADADAFFSEALSVLERNLPSDPSAEAWTLLALNHSKRGKVALAQRRTVEARHHFENALHLLESVPEDKVEDLEDFFRTLATSHSERAELELAETPPNLAGAAHYYDKALDRLAKLKGDYNLSLLAETQVLRASVARLAADWKMAKDLTDQAKAAQAQRVRSGTANAHSRFVLARIYIESAALFRDHGELKEAAEEYRKALELNQELHEGDRTRKSYALAFADNLQAIEALALESPLSPREARGKRCLLVTKFLQSDSKDLRFKRLADGCPPPS
jgi:serine/threonine protein kinase/tetratricopeptide (TPR) repeat protein